MGQFMESDVLECCLVEREGHLLEWPPYGGLVEGSPSIVVRVGLASSIHFKT